MDLRIHSGQGRKVSLVGPLQKQSLSGFFVIGVMWGGNAGAWPILEAGDNEKNEASGGAFGRPNRAAEVVGMRESWIDVPWVFVVRPSEAL